MNAARRKSTKTESGGMAVRFGRHAKVEHPCCGAIFDPVWPEIGTIYTCRGCRRRVRVKSRIIKPGTTPEMQRWKAELELYEPENTE